MKVLVTGGAVYVGSEAVMHFAANLAGIPCLPMCLILLMSAWDWHWKFRRWCWRKYLYNNCNKKIGGTEMGQIFHLNHDSANFAKRTWLQTHGDMLRCTTPRYLWWYFPQPLKMKTTFSNIYKTSFEETRSRCSLAFKY